jgi:hypothetical protein
MEPRKVRNYAKPRTDNFDIDEFQKYVETYKERHPDQQNIMFLDMLYGVGLAIDPEKFKGADGFDKFIDWLMETRLFEIGKRRFETAIKSLVSPESATLKWDTKLNEAFQIAAFGEVIDYKPEDYKDDGPDGNDPGWLANRNHG